MCSPSQKPKILKLVLLIVYMIWIVYYFLEITIKHNALNQILFCNYCLEIHSITFLKRYKPQNMWGQGFMSPSKFQYAPIKIFWGDMIRESCSLMSKIFFSYQKLTLLFELDI